MKLQEVIDNLNRTIAGKRLYLAALDNELARAVVQMNLTELTKIRDDLLQVKDL